MDFLGVGFGELVLILLLALLILGPERLPQIARTLGRVSRQIKQISTDFTKELRREAEDMEAVGREMTQSVRQDLSKIEVSRSDIDLARMVEQTESPSAEVPQNKQDVGKDR